MSLDIAMGGSTNTILHLLAMAQEAEVPFTMADIDRLSRKVPHLCKVAPSSPDVHVEDVHRAGGVMAILGELDRAGLIDRARGPCTQARWERHLPRGTCRGTATQHATSSTARHPDRNGPPNRSVQSQRYPELDLDRAGGAIRDVAHAFSRDGGLAVLFGNIAEEGSVVKTAGVDPAHLVFRGTGQGLREPGVGRRTRYWPARSRPGDVVVIRYEGPRGGPGCRRCCTRRAT